MGDVYDRKKRPFCVYKLLFTYTDDDNQLTMPEIISKLESDYGIFSERKAIYDDIKMLQSLGFDISYSGGRDGGYSLISREFELSQLKLLVDTVQSSKFLTEKQSKELISKLSSLTSKRQADQLKRHVFISNRAKGENKSVYQSVDLINKAINENKQISFKYFNWNEKKEMVLKHGGERYMVSPWEMTINEEKYYLIAYDGKSGKLKHYRVDKMLDCRITDCKREGKDVTEFLDLGEYTKNMFYMFGTGSTELVRISCPNSLAGVIIDRFGVDISMIKENDERFIAAVHIDISPQFFGWLFGLSSNVRIVSPEWAKNEYKKMLASSLESVE